MRYRLAFAAVGALALAAAFGTVGPAWP